MSEYGEYHEKLYDDGKLKKSYYIKNGKLNGPFCYKIDEYDQINANYKNGLLHGPYKNTIGDDTTCTYKNGLKHGSYNNSYARGKAGIYCTYKNGKINGLLKRWSYSSCTTPEKPDAEWEYIDGNRFKYSLFRKNKVILTTGILKNCIEHIKLNRDIDEVIEDVKYMNNDKNILLWNKQNFANQIITIFQNGKSVDEYCITSSKVNDKLIIKVKGDFGHEDIYFEDSAEYSERYDLEDMSD